MPGHRNHDNVKIESIVYDDEKMSTLLKEVSRKIKEERSKRGLSLERMAKIANLTTNCIFKAESFQSELGLKSFLKISTALGMSPEKLLPIENERMQLTNGDLFEQITREADPGTINY